MMITVDTDSEDYRFYKTLNEDVKLIPNKYGKYDIALANGDYVNITGKESLYNAIVIAIMTRFNELSEIPVYEDFGCRIHELIKKTQSDMIEYEMELFIKDVLEQMRRIHEINEITITNLNEDHYKIYFKVTSINDELVLGEVEI